MVRAYRPRGELWGRVVEAFAGRPEVYEIHVFGREVEGTTDEYSDIDLMVCSDDLAATQEVYVSLLDAISPVVGTYFIVCQEQELAQMVMLRDYSPYQKIDFSITASIVAKQGFGPFKCVYRRGGTSGGSRSCLRFDGERETLGNWLNDALFSIPRFAKCLFRRDRDMYRRWNGTVETLAVLLHERCFGWRPEHRYRLMPQEYKALHGRLGTEDEARLEAIQPLDRRPDVAESYQLAMEWIIELYRAKAEALGESVDFRLAEELRGFLGEEVRRFREMGGTARVGKGKLRAQPAAGRRVYDGGEETRL